MCCATMLIYRYQQKISILCLKTPECYIGRFDTELTNVTQRLNTIRQVENPPTVTKTVLVRNISELIGDK